MFKTKTQWFVAFLMKDINSFKKEWTSAELGFKMFQMFSSSASQNCRTSGLISTHQSTWSEVNTFFKKNENYANLIKFPYIWDDFNTSKSTIQFLPF